MIPLINPATAQLSLQTNGMITIDDPESPILVEIGLNNDGRINALLITTRHPTGRISAAAVRRVPLAELHRIARAMRTAQPDETWWHADALRKTGRHWDSDHWQRVRAAAEWATRTKRPGGPAQAIADLWGVSKRPTAYRWMLIASRRTQSPGAGGPTVAGSPTSTPDVPPTTAD